ncbi:hypothetical protein [Nocardia sp. NPDC059239]|uniref:hypothetical protein n=1 Tax=unclassified Nocardia TaxID=2637762 RepID=UPI0036793103
MTSGARDRNIDGGTELKRLLRQKHWDTHKVFQREYNKAARKVDRNLGWLDGPSKAQFYKWLSGDLKGIPQPDHCAVLEAMLPGHTAEELFAPAALLLEVQKTGQSLPVSPEHPVSVEPIETPSTAGSLDRELRIADRAGVPNGSPDRLVGSAGDSNESPDSVVGSGRVRDQREVTAVIDARVRSLMSWIGADTAPLKERDIHRDNVRDPSAEAPARPAVDRRRSR